MDRRQQGVRQAPRIYRNSQSYEEESWSGNEESATPGAMNYIGTVSPETHLKGDVFDLYERATKQAPDGDIPFLIFIDANVPDSPQKGLPSYSDIPVDTVPWMKEIRDRLVEIWNAATEPTPESAVLITN